jgi:hypothetical protein
LDTLLHAFKEHIADETYRFFIKIKASDKEHPMSGGGKHFFG